MKTQWRAGAPARGEIEPSFYQATLGLFTLTVHRHIAAPGAWFATCSGVLTNRDLDTANADHAKAAALALLIERLQDGLSAAIALGASPGDDAKP